MKTLEALKKLKPLIGNDTLIITGSTAIALHGLGKLESCNDLDLILVKGSETTKEVFNRLQKDTPSPRFKQGGSIAYSFIFETVKIDIWTVDTIESNLVKFDDMPVASLQSIIDAKLTYNRPKDWVQLLKLSKIFFDPKKLDGSLESINTSDGGYEG